MRYMAKEASQMGFAVAVLGGGDATIFRRVSQRKKHLSWGQLMEFSCGQDAEPASPGQERCSLQRWTAKLGVSVSKTFCHWALTLGGVRFPREKKGVHSPFTSVRQTRAHQEETRRMLGRSLAHMMKIPL